MKALAQEAEVAAGKGDIRSFLDHKETLRKAKHLPPPGA